MLVLVAAVSAGLWSQEQGQSAQEKKPIQQLAWLIGGVWTADASKMGGGMQRIETRYDWSDNHAFVRFNTHFVTDKAAQHTYDGQFFWDGQDQALKMWYMDARSSITQGIISVSGETFNFDFRGTDFEGKPADLRVELLRKTNDRYIWQLEEKAPEGWKQLASLEYVRQP
jgi:hypothetical protein